MDVLQFSKVASSGLHDVLLVLCGLADDLRRREEVLWIIAEKKRKHIIICVQDCR